MTWKDLIRLTLQDLRVWGVQSVPNPNDEQYAVDRLDLWLDFQKTKGQAVYQVARTLWNLSTAASYTVGTGGTVNVARPLNAQRIRKLAYVDNNLTPAVEIDLGIPLTRAQYEALPYKSFQSQYPNDFYYEPTFPNGTIYSWPIPTTANLQGVIYSDVPVDEITDRTAPISLPPGYKLWILKRVKLELRDAFKVPVDEANLQRWEREAVAIEEWLFAGNEELPPDIGFGVAGVMFGGATGQKSNIYTGEE